ncbi:MAG TPA: CPBP family intramembrane glutamic endopeptidase [Polyangiaceae bacterium]|nr:CPBP family intramembrane glutamic endopeptidase [Polyangiaceae bacterium]
MTSRVVYAVSFAGLLTLSSVGLITILLSLGAARLGAFGGSLVFGALVEGLVYLALSLWLARDLTSPGARLGLVPVPVVLLLLGVGLGIALHGPADFIEALVERWLPLPDAVALERVRRLSPSDPLERASLLAAAAALVPLVEELFFRGSLLAWLERVSTPRVAAWLCAVCFTLSHAEPRSWPALGLVASALGFLRWASGALLPCILLHATFNATTLAVLFVQSPKALAHSEPAWWPFLGGSVLSAGLLLGAWRLRQPAPRFAQ